MPVPPPACATPPAVQHEFLTQCLRQLVLARQPAGAVYILAMRWISMATASSSSSSSKVVKDRYAACYTACVRNILLHHGRMTISAPNPSSVIVALPVFASASHECDSCLTVCLDLILSTPASTAAPLTMDAVRLQHLRILLAAGGGSRDEEAEQMVSQVSGAVRSLPNLLMGNSFYVCETFCAESHSLCC